MKNVFPTALVSTIPNPEAPPETGLAPLAGAPSAGLD